MNYSLSDFKTPWRLSIVQFAAVGAISTLLDIGVLNIVQLLTGQEYLATALGFIVGATNGYLLNSRFVFKQSFSSQQYRRYVFIGIIGLLITELIIDVLHLRQGLLSLNGAKLVAVIVVFFWNYTLSKIWAFK